jgi:hypothetical protein
VTAAPRRILGNLLAEDDLARLADPRRRHRPPNQNVLRTVARMATRLRVFAREGDRLWLPAPVDPATVPGIVLESGPLDSLEPTAELLAWCETPSAVRLRSAPRNSAIPWDAPLHEIVWHLPVAPPEVVAAVHHRSFHLRVAEELGCALPGARMVESFGELERVLAAPAAPESWVVKAPFSASGRARYLMRQGPLLPDEKAHRTVKHLFEVHGPLLFEPWMDRIADYGCAALLTATELRIAGIHRQRVDLKGQFAGIDLNADLSVQDRERFQEVVEGVASALRREGYAGPFGVDAWTYRRPDGSTAFHPLGEINARMTFGLVAWAEAGRGPSALEQLRQAE